MSIRDCFAENIAVLVKKADKLRQSAEMGRATGKKLEEITSQEQAMRLILDKLDNETKGQLADRGLDPSKTDEALVRARDILVDRIENRKVQAVKSRAIGKQIASNIFQDINAGASVDSIVHAFFYGGYQPGRVMATKSFSGTSIIEAIQGRQNLASAELMRILNVDEGALVKVHDVDFADEVARAYEHRALGKGKPSQNASANKVAQQLEDMSFTHAKELKAAGIDVQATKGYYLSIDIDPRAIRRMGHADRQGLKALLGRTLDREHIAEQLSTLDLVNSSKQWDNFLEDVIVHYESGGRAKLGSSQLLVQRGVSSIANSRTFHRLLRTADVAAWKELHKELGTSTNFLMHVNSKVNKFASDVTWAERMGPSPGAALSYLNKELKRISPALAEQVDTKLRNTLKLHLSPNNSDAIPEALQVAMGTMAGAARGSLLWNTSIQTLMESLGNSAGAHMRGVSTFNRFFKGLGNMFNPKLASDRAEAAIAGRAVITFQNEFNNQLSEVPRGIERLAGKYANFTRVYSLLDRATAATRKAYSDEVEQTLGKWAQDKLNMNRPKNKNFDQSVRQLGITNADKKTILKYTSPEHGLDLVDMHASNVLEDRQLARKLSFWSNEAAQVQAPDSSPWLSGKFKELASGGRAPALLSKNLQMFTGFLGGTIEKQIMPIMRMSGARRLGYAGTFILTNMFTSAVYIQLMRVSRGEEPLPVGPQLFIRAAAATPFGPIGKVLMAGSELGLPSVYASMASTLVAPAVNALSDIRQGRQPDRLGKDLVNMAKLFIPGSNAWFASQALAKFIFDPIEKSIDKEQFYKRKSRKEQQMRKYKEEAWL